MPPAAITAAQIGGPLILSKLFGPKTASTQKGGPFTPQQQDTSSAQTGITDLARMLQGQAGGIYNVGMPAYQRATSFYNNLLGDRTQQTASLAPALENNAASAAGTQNAIRTQTQRGPTQDLALAQAKMQQQGQAANMYRDAPFQAAQALGGLGLQGLGQAGQQAGLGMQGYSSLFSGLNNANQLGYQNMINQQQQSRQFGSDMGGLLLQLLPLLSRGGSNSGGTANNTIWGGGMPSRT